MTPGLIAAAPTHIEPDRLKAHVKALTSTSKPRHYLNHAALDEAAKYIRTELAQSSSAVCDQTFSAMGRSYKNIIARFGPTDAPRLVVGAHYDVAGDQPGADDNASGVAGLLELARLLKSRSRLRHHVELVAYCLEEPPFFGSQEMGSAVHASSLKKSHQQVALMMSLEMIGFFSEKEGSQQYPVPALKWVYPSKGNFIGVVGDLKSVRLVARVKRLIQKHSKIDVHSINAPHSLPGVDLSDHRNYWEQGFPAVMITDTAFFRNPYYHTPQDRWDTLNYDKMAEVVKGVFGVLTEF